MIATDALVILAVLMAALVAVGIRIALSLKDIGSSLEKIAAGDSARGSRHGSTSPSTVPASSVSASSSTVPKAGTPDDDPDQLSHADQDAEISAAIAVAARALRKTRK